MLFTFSQFIMPGLVDTHIHAPQYHFTGTGYDKQLLEWLDTYTFPTEGKFRDVQFAREVYPKVVVSGKTEVVYVTLLCMIAEVVKICVVCLESLQK